MTVLRAWRLVVVASVSTLSITFLFVDKRTQHIACNFKRVFRPLILNGVVRSLKSQVWGFRRVLVAFYRVVHIKDRTAVLRWFVTKLLAVQ